jgi:hypothetical protein
MIKKLFLGAAASLSILALSACGGGGSSATPQPVNKVYLRVNMNDVPVASTDTLWLGIYKNGKTTVGQLGPTPNGSVTYPLDGAGAGGWADQIAVLDEDAHGNEIAGAVIDNLLIPTTSGDGTYTIVFNLHKGQTVSSGFRRDGATIVKKITL